jgi:hypothetical protein
MVCRKGVSSIALIGALVLTGAATEVRDVDAQQLNRAGLVVAHSDGTVLTRCVEFSEPEITGDELLTRAGLSIVVDPYPGTGVAVCAIDGEGCAASDCFCQCRGSPCVYWAYYRLVNGQWEYSGMGASTLPARNGDVQGWAWGEGGTGGGALPPLLPFDEVCIPPTPTPTNTPLPTDTPTPVPPTATHTVTSVPPSPTLRPPTATPIPADTATPKPSNTPVSTATRTDTPPATAASTDTPESTQNATSTPPDGVVPAQAEALTNTPVPTVASTGTPTSPATPLPEPPTTTPAESMTPGAITTSMPAEQGSQKPPPTPSPYSALAINTRTPMPTAIPREAMARAALATPTLLVAVRRPTDVPAQRVVAPAPTPRAPSGTQGTESYLLFGVLAAGLVAGLAVLQVRKRR